MRKLNLVLVIGILLTFLTHALMGAFKLFGADTAMPKALSYTALSLVAAHVVVTCLLTIKTLRTQHHSGAGYFKNNLMFWARRISGLAILIPLVMHIVIFSGTDNGEVYRLVYFNIGRLVSQILFVLTLALHIIININPMLMGLGVKQHKAFSADFCFVLSVILLITSIAFLIYYVRWITF